MPNKQKSIEIKVRQTLFFMLFSIIEDKDTWQQLISPVMQVSFV
jgi:hypothetical protein